MKFIFIILFTIFNFIISTSNSKYNLKTNSNAKVENNEKAQLESIKTKISKPMV